jgi:hypothetical protein
MPSYSFVYGLAWVNGAVLVVATVLAGSGLTVHPSWLTPDVTATAAILVPICGGLAHFLPPLTRTPAKREAKYFATLAGVPPKDIAEKMSK